MICLHRARLLTANSAGKLLKSAKCLIRLRVHVSPEKKKTYVSRKSVYSLLCANISSEPLRINYEHETVPSPNKLESLPNVIAICPKYSISSLSNFVVIITGQLPAATSPDSCSRDAERQTMG